MDSNNDDSAAARENLDETVCPMPPTGPRVVAVRLPAQSLFFVAIPEMLNGFQMPRWGRSAWHCLFTAFVLSWCDLYSPTPAKIVSGLVLYFLTWPIIGFLFAAYADVYKHATFASIRPERSMERFPLMAGEIALFADTYSHPSPMPVAAVTLIVGLRTACRLMFFVWGLSILFSSHRQLITLVALIFWVGLLIAGVGVAVVNSVKQWLLVRRQSTG